MEAIVFSSLAIIARDLNIVAGILFDQELANCYLLVQEIK